MKLMELKLITNNKYKIWMDKLNKKTYEAQ